MTKETIPSEQSETKEAVSGEQEIKEAPKQPETKKAEVITTA